MKTLTAGTLIHPRSESNELLPHMPVLDMLRRNVGSLDLSVIGLVGLQHLFGSTASLLNTLAGSSLQPGDVHVLGKPYSANPRVVEYLRNELGYWVHPDTVFQPNNYPNDELMDERISHMLDRIQMHWRSRRTSSRQRYVLIDDGGRAIRLLHTPQYQDIRSLFTCVEQTRCGIRTIEDLNLQVPVVNVAESWVKLEHESPLIAESVNEQLSRQIEILRRSGMEIGKHVSVVGYGAIGAAVSREMARTGFDVAVHDDNARRRIDARNDGYTLLETKGAVWDRGGIVIGCTGLPVLDQAEHGQIANGTLLISASSADVEFRAWQIRPLGRNLGIPASGSDCHRPDHPCFSLYEVEQEGRCFHLLNGGFPVNFNGGVDTIAPEKIQLTRSLLYLGAVQASRTGKPGLHDLDQDHQELLFRLFQACTELQAA